MPSFMGPIDRAANQCVKAIIFGGALKATKYVHENLTVKATRKLYGKNRKPSRRLLSEIVLTIGPPNFAERRFIKALGKAGEPFPVKKVQLKMPKGK